MISENGVEMLRKTSVRGVKMAKLVKCKTCGADVAKSAKVCPQCGAKQKKHTIFGVLLVIIGVFLFISSFSGTDQLQNDDKQDDYQQEEKDTQSKEKEIIDISAEQLYETYTENTVNADNLYKNKTLRVDGIVVNIGQDAVSKKPCISLAVNTNYDLFPVQCFFNKATDDISNLRNGDSVVIVGKCIGYNVAYVQLTNCEIE